MKLYKAVMPDFTSEWGDVVIGNSYIVMAKSKKQALEIVATKTDEKPTDVFEINNAYETE